MADAPAAGLPPRGDGEPGAGPANGAVVVVIEDEPQIRRFLRPTLASQGYRVVEAVSGEEGVLQAEALAGITLAQLVSPGYGSFLSNTDMQSGSPCFGTPESAMGLFVSAQLARRYHLPFRGGGGLTPSKLPDAQAAYEAMAPENALVSGPVWGGSARVLVRLTPACPPGRLRQRIEAIAGWTGPSAGSEIACGMALR